MSEQIKSLSKALTVLEFLGNYPNGISLQKVSEGTGFNKSSVHRILATFEASGYVAQMCSGKEYRLTMKLVQLGHAAINSDVTGTVKPYLSELLDDVNETVNFLSFDADNIIFKDKFEPVNSAFRTRTYVGLHSPMYCSAAGKCYLAFSSDTVRETYWQRNVSTMKPLTENTILDKSQFFDVLDKIKARGYALDDEENEAGISCVAVPIFDKNKSPVYAVSVSSLTPKMKALGYGEIANKIQDITARIEQQLF
ncbi:IclR family transcriptional regulator [Vibrio sp. 10N.261.46.E12]|uniref:IclR family transcriptional regulator n=1 Tax=unclassified Vibrio TaxID=2614977 RepID=UPI0009760E88|nr:MULTISPECIES: IclR family transcriptional regulator [unclassified Vibrio]OMO35869.1 IclR family transcriptional regulator [Vibrio sp. 10N.261.45.E1]PMJ28497.1 IclR family transcriptional regulator [Vibrio sp. 10N.286.45.B6]PML98536.1 IclR family transcriptional regulator [Vibrio sp. 10N.261.49.E11]PMM68237.1 IclR family transcriptional regulator [Vibrio sp. 10N.261.46.F12]PMM83043.1 IclR family transcriptional regulator [Vibrio sp. 10N.261.46.E8]